MEYEKLYNEAIERAKKHCADYVVETIFPELAESEDERIRKAMIDLFKHEREEGITVLHYGVNIECMIDWLEKQGEHAKFCDSIQVGDKVTRNQDGVLVNLSQLKRVAKKDEKQGEQKPDTDFSDLRTWKYIVDAVLTEKELIGQYRDRPFTEEVAKKLQKRFGKIEQKSAWSDEDERIIYNIEQFLHLVKNNPQVRNDLHKEAKNWLKSLKDRVQPKQEWLGGDEAHLHSLITHLEQWIERHPNTTGADIQGENITWLKSLRPQSQWKPSDEQMEALWDSIPENVKEISEREMLLDSLYQDLKKIKGE